MNRLANSNRSGIVRRASDIFQRLFSRSNDATSTDRPLPPGTPPSPDRPRMRFVFVGDSGCGKSSMLMYAPLFILLVAPLF